MGDVLAPFEVERRIAHVLDALDERTEDFERLAEAAAKAEAEYRKTYAKTMLDVIQTRARSTVQERTARVELSTAQAHREYLIARAARDSCREALTALREQLGGLRSLNVNVRQVSGLNQ